MFWVLKQHVTVSMFASRWLWFHGFCCLCLFTYGVNIIYFFTEYLKAYKMGL